MLPYGPAFITGEGEAAGVEDLQGDDPVTAPVLAACLAEVMEECRDCDAVWRKGPGMGAHVIVHLEGMGGQAAALPVVVVAPACEIAGRPEVVEYGVLPRAVKTVYDLQYPVLILALGISL